MPGGGVVWAHSHSEGDPMKKGIVRAGTSKLLLVALFCALGLAVTMAVEMRGGSPASVDPSSLSVGKGAMTTQVDAPPAHLKGEVRVVVRLVDAPLAVAQGKNAKQHGGKLNGGQQRAYLQQLGKKQDDIS